jgi:hypothetical protein
VAATDLSYLELRQRIVGNLNRSDLDTVPVSSSSVVHQFVLDRCNYYAKEFFYSAKTVDTSKVTVIGDQWLDLPSGWQDVESLRILQGSNWVPVTRTSHDVVLHQHVVTPPIRTLPSMYALHPNPSGAAMAIRFFPAPDLVYSVELAMDGTPAAPTSDTDINFWTQDASTLLIESVCEEISRNRLNRPMKADQHRGNKEREEASLWSKSVRVHGGLQAKIYL